MSGAVLFVSTEENSTTWSNALLTQAPEMDLRVWPNVGTPEDVEYAIVARPPSGELAQLPNLKAVFSMWAGVEDLLADSGIAHLPIIRMTEPGLTNGMVVYVVHHVTGFHIHSGAYKSFKWEHPFHANYKSPCNTCVGILGLGVLGVACAQALIQLGFTVIGYSNTRKKIANVESYAGETEIPEFLSRSEVLVCLLPRTVSTDNFLNRNTLKMLPRGARIINCGRGEAIDDDALLEAIHDGQVSGAVLDVFKTEPLPINHPYWGEPNVLVTPHCASKPDPKTASAVIIEKIKKLEQGLLVEGLVDRTRTY